MHLILLISGVMSMWAAKPLLHSSGGRFLVKELAGAGQKKMPVVVLRQMLINMFVIYLDPARFKKSG
jgi:hypothetical protein